jgi:hypothetical protein
MTTQNQIAEPSPLVENMQLISLLKSDVSETNRTMPENRLDDAFQAYINRERRSRSWNPIWTASLRAEKWAQFALHTRELIKASGVPAAYWTFDLECIPKELPTGYRRVAKELLVLLTCPKILALCGPYRTGKTTLAWGAAMKFCSIGRKAVYRTVAEMFAELNDAPWEKKQQIRERLYAPDLLVLDEVQVRSSNREWEDNELTTLIDRRWRDQKATILVSNLKVEELRANLGGSIWGRLVESGGPPIEAAWDRIEVVLERLKLKKTAKDVPVKQTLPAPQVAQEPTAK